MSRVPFAFVFFSFLIDFLVSGVPLTLSFVFEFVELFNINIVRAKVSNARRFIIHFLDTAE